MDPLNYLKYDAEVFTPPFRLGRKQQRAVLDSKGKEVVIFPPNSSIQANLYVNYLNGETKIEYRKFSYKRFLLLISAILLVILGFIINEKMFPKTSIWSWGHYTFK